MRSPSDPMASLPGSGSQPFRAAMPAARSAIGTANPGQLAIGCSVNGTKSSSIKVDAP